MKGCKPESGEPTTVLERQCIAVVRLDIFDFIRKSNKSYYLPGAYCRGD